MHGENLKISKKIQVFMVKLYKKNVFLCSFFFGLTILRNLGKYSPKKTASNYVGFKSSENRLRGTQGIETTRLTCIITVRVLQDTETTRVTLLLRYGFYKILKLHV